MKHFRNARKAELTLARPRKTKIIEPCRRVRKLLPCQYRLLGEKERMQCLSVAVTVPPAGLQARKAEAGAGGAGAGREPLKFTPQVPT